MHPPASKAPPGRRAQAAQAAPLGASERRPQLLPATSPTSAACALPRIECGGAARADRPRPRFRLPIHTTDRPADSRQQRLLRRPSVRLPDREDPCSSRRKRSCFPAARSPCTPSRRPYCSREVFELGIPILGICYGMQLTAYLLDGQSRSGGGARVRARGDRRDRRVAALRGHAEAPAGLGQPRRPHPRRRRPASTSPPPRRTRRSPRSRIASAAATASSSIPRSRTPRRARRSSATSCSTSPSASRRGTSATSAGARSKRSGSRSATARPSPR